MTNKWKNETTTKIKAPTRLSTQKKKKDRDISDTETERSLYYVPAALMSNALDQQEQQQQAKGIKRVK